MFGYNNEVAELIEYGYPFDKGVDTQIAEELGITEKHIPELIRLAVDISFLKYEDNGFDSETHWTNVNAWAVLKELKAEAALEPLISLFTTEYDPIISDFLPDFFLSFRFAKVKTLLGKYLFSGYFSSFGNRLYVEILSKFADKRASYREKVIREFSEIINDFDDNDPSLNAAIGRALSELGISEMYPTIIDAYKEDALDEEIFQINVFASRIKMELMLADNKQAEHLNSLLESVYEEMVLRFSPVESFKFRPEFLNVSEYNPENPVHNLILNWISENRSSDELEKTFELYNKFKIAPVLIAIFTHLKHVYKPQDEALDSFYLFERLQQPLKELKELPRDATEDDAMEKPVFFRCVYLLTQLLIENDEFPRNDLQIIFNFACMLGFKRLNEERAFTSFKNYEDEFLVYMNKALKTQNLSETNEIIKEFGNTTDETGKSLLEYFEEYILLEMLLLLYFALKPLKTELPLQNSEDLKENF